MMRLMLLMILMCSFPMDCYAQIRGIGRAAARGLFRGTGKGVAKKGATSFLKKSTRGIGKHSVSKAAKFVATKGLRSASGKLARKFPKQTAKITSRLKPQQARRMAMLEDQIAKSPHAGKLMKLLEKRGDADKIIDFLYRNKGTIFGGVVLASFVMNPEPYLNSTEKLASNVVKTTGESVVEPVVDKVAAPIAGWVGFTVSVLAIGGAMLLAGYWFIRRKFSAVIGLQMLGRFVFPSKKGFIK